MYSNLSFLYLSCFWFVFSPYVNASFDPLSYTENFLYMMDRMTNANYKPNPRLARALDILFILHAEHEMNCSTAAMRHLASRFVKSDSLYDVFKGECDRRRCVIHFSCRTFCLKFFINYKYDVLVLIPLSSVVLMFTPVFLAPRRLSMVHLTEGLMQQLFICCSPLEPQTRFHRCGLHDIFWQCLFIFF